jgi:hypothetical protein
MTLRLRTIRAMDDPELVLEALRAQEHNPAPLAPPTAAEAATLAVTGPWGPIESVAVLAPWALVALAMFLLTFGGVTVALVLAAQVLAAVVTTVAVLWIRYRRREDARHS